GKVVVPTITQPMIDQFRLIKKELNGTGYEISYNSQGLRRFAYFQKVLVRIKTENAPKYHEAKSAFFETIINITPGDTTPPWVTNLKPLVNEVNVLPGSNIKFDVLDDSMGVDPASIKVQVSTQKGSVSFDSTHKAVEYGPKAKGFEVTINPKIPFFYNDTVTVTIEARDKEPNIMAPFKYRFFLGLDKTAPVLQAIDPYDKQKNVTNTPVFKVLAQDPLAGIDKSTYQLRYRYWDATEYIPIAPEFFEFNLDTIQIKAGTDTLLFDTTVVVQATIKDRVGNLGNLEYSFKVMKEDTIPPSITLVKPQYDRKYDYHPDQLNEFIVTIIDSYADINTESIKIVVSVFSDTTQPPEKSKEFQKESATWSGEKLVFTPASGKSVQVTCKAQQEPLIITKNQFIRMWVYAEDKFRNPVQGNYEFGTQADRQAPVLLYAMPVHQAQDVSPDTRVSLKFTDDPDGDGKDYSGVKLASVRVLMRIIDSNSTFDNDWSKAELIYPGLMTTIEPEPEPKIELAENSGKFSVNQRIYLNIFAEDLVQNQLDTTIWFETPKETPDLSFQNTNYRIVSDVGTDSVQVECSVTVLNEFARVNVSELSVLFEKPDGKKENISITGQLEIGETALAITPLMTIYKYGTQVIKVSIDPNNNVPEKDENNNSTTINIPGKTRIYAEPEIFSPNGDGINDETFIHCDGFDLNNPIIKIYDLQGRSIRDLTEFVQNPLRFRWDGRDHNGRIVVPGVYIYMLYDGTKTLGRGCVVVVL
ncbi:gliding motility-associated C-terminal domain-containing protein, partial [candidate division KSB1 bacterium]|nr:gliding motility-associated C-terminal domain-containing protein [candidate division KSB1 bacterium]